MLSFRPRGEIRNLKDSSVALLLRNDNINIYKLILAALTYTLKRFLYELSDISYFHFFTFSINSSFINYNKLRRQYLFLIGIVLYFYMVFARNVTNCEWGCVIAIGLLSVPTLLCLLVGFAFGGFHLKRKLNRPFFQEEKDVMKEKI